MVWGMGSALPTVTNLVVSEMSGWNFSIPRNEFYTHLLVFFKSLSGLYKINVYVYLSRIDLLLKAGSLGFSRSL
jgi:hypothetical protein